MSLRPFNDSPVVSFKTFVAGGTDTSVIDPFRQGIELSNHAERFSKVFFRISTGEDDNALLDYDFGQVKQHVLAIDATFQDNDKLDARQIIASPEMTYPLVIGDELSYSKFTMDGSLDVFGIRSQIAGHDMEFPVSFRGIRAEFSAGNVSVIRTCNVIVQETDTVQISPEFAFLDNVNPHVDYHNFGLNQIYPFNDAPTLFLNRNTKLTSNADAGVVTAEYNLEPGTDNFNERYVKSMPAGFVFDCLNDQGTDSLAFGGFLYCS